MYSILSVELIKINEEQSVSLFDITNKLYENSGDEYIIEDVYWF